VFSNFEEKGDRDGRRRAVYKRRATTSQNWRRLSVKERKELN
jgi:hypothetical protein